MIVEAKFLARNGPSGWYSHAWISRADQSFSRQKPAMCSAAAPIGMGEPRCVAGADPDAELELVIETAARAEVGSASPGGLRWPFGRRTGVPETRIDEARP